MTEVRCSESGGHLGLFALKDFSLGDVILEENPVVRLAPPNEKASRELLSEWKDGLSSEEVFSGFDDWDKLRKILLIWACNSFQGGRVYPKISRVNHSCNPNALIQTTTTTTTTTSDAGQKDENFSNNNNNNEGQKLLAATKIKTGTEICISYLGLFLYTDTTVRRKKLERTKFFRCACARCTDAVSRGGEEGAARIPCPKTHPRDSKTLSLDEDVQYDDDQSVKYTCFVPTATAAGAAEPTNGGGGGNDEDEKLRKAMSRRMILTQELPEEDEIAEAIDSLQRVYRFVDSLHHGRGKGRRGDLDLDTAELNTDPGHLLGDVTIGTARMLISLGDVKSQKYGADWLGKIEEYVDTFCDPGVQKVVSVLKAAWKKHNHGRSDESSGDGGNKKKKKAKVV
eukprot:jgi/Psemu1/284683/fgenesh1_pg.61_\